MKKRLIILIAAVIGAAFSIVDNTPAEARVRSRDLFFDSTRATLPVADSIFQEMLLGPKAISLAFGIPVSDITVPPIPYTVGELQFFRKLGYMLVLQVDSVGGQPLTMKRQVEVYEKKMTSDEKLIFTNVPGASQEAFFTSEVPQTGWRLVSGDIVSGSVEQDYMQQTAVLKNYPEDYKIPGYVTDDSPSFVDAMQKADLLFKENKKHRKATGNQDDTTGLQKAAKLLAGMHANTEHRETAVEVLYRIILYHAAHGKSLFPDRYVWTRSLSSDNKFVGIGCFITTDPKAKERIDKDKTGLSIDKKYPNTSGPARGTTFVYRSHIVR